MQIPFFPMTVAQWCMKPKAFDLEPPHSFCTGRPIKNKNLCALLGGLTHASSSDKKKRVASSGVFAWLLFLIC